MKKAIMLALAALLVAGAPSALAQRGGGGGGGKKGADAPSKPLPPRPEFTTGIVASYVPDSRTLKLNTGGEYRLTPAASTTTAAIHSGDKVQLRWLMKGGIRIVDEATITQPAPPAAATTAAPDKASADKPAPAAPATPASPS